MTTNVHLLSARLDNVVQAMESGAHRAALSLLLEIATEVKEEAQLLDDHLDTLYQDLGDVA